ncbi:hypothetical protein ACGYLO_11255 [Sulfitobacter sp. 1A13353]|jgi:hypothetical protein|uniref:hypothetical protein n=1 Tax=Sulfitobacter sp. 1A13353 TaxID=3368568 RepID=UPI0037467E74
MLDYPKVCREAFALVDDIGKGAFNTEFSERGTLATTVEVAMPVLAVFRELDPRDRSSILACRARLAKIASKEQGVFSRYPALTGFALGKAITVQ